MGLDMYLSAKRYIWDKEGEGVEVNGVDIPAPLKLKELGCRAAYWRKANAIHNWFVENVQGGADNCAQYEVTAHQLEELRDECQRVIDDPKLGAEALPTAKGFFFGSTDYDEGYAEDLQYTIDAVNELLATPRDYNWSFFYQSSW